MRYNEQVQLLQGNGEKGPSIIKFRYDKIKKAMLSAVDSEDWILFDDVKQQTLKRLTPFDRNSLWYMDALATDLEERGIFETRKINGDKYIRTSGRLV